MTAYTPHGGHLLRNLCFLLLSVLAAGVLIAESAEAQRRGGGGRDARPERTQQAERPARPERVAKPDRRTMPQRRINPERRVAPDRRLTPERRATPSRRVTPDRRSLSEPGVAPDRQVRPDRQSAQDQRATLNGRIIQQRRAMRSERRIERESRMIRDRQARSERHSRDDRPSRTERRTGPEHSLRPQRHARTDRLISRAEQRLESGRRSNGNDSFTAQAAPPRSIGEVRGLVQQWYGQEGQTSSRPGNRTIQYSGRGGRNAAARFFDLLTGGQSIPRGGGRLSRLSDGTSVQISSRVGRNGNTVTSIRINHRRPDSNVIDRIKIRFVEG